MKRRGLSQLSIYKIQENQRSISFDLLKTTYLKKVSEIVYIIEKNKLKGIICLGDVLRCIDGKVNINIDFSFVIGFDVNKANEIFRKNRNINHIPITNEKGELLADYSRWEDEFFNERNHIWFSKKNLIENILGPYNMIYIVTPNDKGNSSYLFLLQCLDQFGINYIHIENNAIGSRMEENSVVIFSDEDERRAMQCFMQITLNVDGRILNSQHRQTWITYKMLLKRIIQARNQKVLGKFENEDEKASVLFSKLIKDGICCLVLYANANETTEYAQKFKEMLAQRLEKHPCLQEAPWVTGKVAEKFWGELYQLEDYKNEVVQKELAEGWRKGRYQNISGKYCNVQNGRRITCYQPKDYIGTIYFLGPCIMFGAYAEDQYTIESYLQKMLMEKGVPYRVENYASQLRLDSELEDRLMEIKYLSPNDIIIYLSQEGEVNGARNYPLWKIYESQHVPIDWVTNWYIHCNYRINQILANSIFEFLQPCLRQQEIINENIHIDIRSTMKDYVYYKYLERYFNGLDLNRYKTIGAIVMNCNPFSKGHRYLITQAKLYVDFLIVFVVEEDASFFSFEERYKMVMDGTSDIKDIMVVPSGEFILSKNTFQEYFTKIETELIRLNAKYDINVFADYIAEPLHITHRFAGEEPNDKITSIYNQAMEEILPQKGINFVEIPRLKVLDKIVSASAVRECLKYGDYSKAAALLPDTTISFLLK